MLIALVRFVAKTKMDRGNIIPFCRKESNNKSNKLQLKCNLDGFWYKLDQPTAVY